MRIRRSIKARTLALLLGWLGQATILPQLASAHGLHGHVHVTGWAIENLPPGDLRDIFDDPDVFHAALSGSMFPDTGYATSAPGARDYGEAAHWEPFIEPFIQAVRTKYGPSYDSKEEKMLIAFLLGCASHGLEDELFDSTFLFEVEERDGSGQEITDPATDGFLILDGYFRLLPGDFFPIDEVLPIVAPLNPAINSALIAEQVRIVREGYVNDGLGARIAAANGRRYRRYIPWASAHYLDPSTPGSLGAEVEATARHMQALWDRLYGNFDEANLVVHAWPEAPRRLRSWKHTNVASWITLILGKGIQEGSATASLIDAEGNPVPFQLNYTRWGGTSRLVRFKPSVDLVPGATYTAILEAGATLIDGSKTTIPYRHRFQVECDPDAMELCEPVAVTDDPIVEPAPATASPTLTPTATEMPSPTATATIQPSPTATSSATTTASTTATFTPTPTATASFTASATPSASGTTTATPSPSATNTQVPTLTLSPSTTPTDVKPVSDSGCQLIASEPSMGSWLPWILGALGLTWRRFARSSRRATK